MTCPDLPNCVLDVTGTPLGPGFGVLGNPYGGFGGQVGGGGYPTAFPKFQPPPPKRLPTPGPIFTPAPRQTAPPTAPVPPAKPPPGPPPATPVGEPPPSEPPYSTYDPNVLSDIAAAEKAAKLEAQLAYWERFFTRMGPLIYAAGGDFFNLLTYTADLGPSAVEEAASIAGQLVPIMSPLSEAQLTHVSIDPASFVSPDNLGLLDSLPELTVTGQQPRAAPALAPVLLPLGGLSPFALPKVGAAPLAQRLADPLASPAAGVSPALRPFVIPGTRLAGGVPIVAPGAPYGFASPLVGTNPLEATQPQAGTKPTSTDCQTTSQGKKKGKKKARNVCWKGSYVERRSGLLKFKKERIPCR